MTEFLNVLFYAGITGFGVAALLSIAWLSKAIKAPYALVPLIVSLIVLSGYGVSSKILHERAKTSSENTPQKIKISQLDMEELSGDEVEALSEYINIYKASHGFTPLEGDPEIAGSPQSVTKDNPCDKPMVKVPVKDKSIASSNGSKVYTPKKEEGAFNLKEGFAYIYKTPSADKPVPIEEQSIGDFKHSTEGRDYEHVYMCPKLIQTKYYHKKDCPNLGCDPREAVGMSRGAVAEGAGKEACPVCYPKGY